MAPTKKTASSKKAADKNKRPTTEPSISDLNRVLEKQASRRQANPDRGTVSLPHSSATVLEAPESLPNDLIQEMRDEINAMKQQGKQQQEQLRSVRAKLAAKTETPFTWKKEGNRHQFEVLNRIVEISHQAKSTYASQGTKEGDLVMDELVAAANARIKLLKIADTSPNGWSMVAEYETKPFTTDEADDAKLKRAEKSASEKQALKAQERKSKQARYSPYQQNHPQFNNAYRGNTGFNSYNRQEEGGTYRAYGGFKNTNAFRPSTMVPDKPAPRRNINNDLCYNCGGRGHWANTCTEKKTEPEQQTK